MNSDEYRSKKIIKLGQAHVDGSQSGAVYFRGGGSHHHRRNARIRYRIHPGSMPCATGYATASMQTMRREQRLKDSSKSTEDNW